MTSEFEGDWSPMELKFLLVKWRYFYRSIYSMRETGLLEGEKKIVEQCEYALLC
jgi:hypothetical protein